MLNQVIKKNIEKSVLCWLATTDANGQPNVSPKELFTFDGDHHLLIANVASPGTIKNVKVNAKVCVSCIDIFVQKGYKFKGTATIINKSDDLFKEKVAPLKKMAGDAFSIASVIRIEVNSIDKILAPSYRFFPETKEEDQIKSAMRTYGVEPIG